MSMILDPRSENYKRTLLYLCFNAGFSSEAVAETLAANFPAITIQEVNAWFVRFGAGNLEIGENVSINAEGIVVDRSVRLKRELDEAEQADGEPPARRNPNPLIVPKRKMEEEEGRAHQHPQGNGVANHVVAQQQPAPNNVPIVAVIQNPANRDPQVVPKIEVEDGDYANHARANLVNEVNQAPAIYRNQRESMVCSVRHAQQEVAIPPQHPLPVPIQPGPLPVNLVNQFLPAPLSFQMPPQILSNLQLNQFKNQLSLLLGLQPVINPPFNAGFGIQNWQLPHYQQQSEEQNQVAVDNNHLEEDVEMEMRVTQVSVRLGKNAAAVVLAQRNHVLEILFIKKNYGCTIKFARQQYESPSHFIDRAMIILKWVTTIHRIEIEELEIICQSHVTSFDDIKMFYNSVAETLLAAPCHIEEFTLENWAPKRLELIFNWNSFIIHTLMGMKVGPLKKLTWKSHRADITLSMNEMRGFTSHLRNFDDLEIVGFVLRIADIGDLSHMSYISMTVEQMSLESVPDYKNRIQENEDFDCHIFHFHSTSNGNILTSLQPFEASTRGTEDFDGMFPLHHSEDYAIFFRIQSSSIKFDKLLK